MLEVHCLQISLDRSAGPPPPAPAECGVDFQVEGGQEALADGHLLGVEEFKPGPAALP